MAMEISDLILRLEGLIKNLRGLFEKKQIVNEIDSIDKDFKIQKIGIIMN